MKHSFTTALTARKVDFMMIITAEGSKSGRRGSRVGPVAPRFLEERYVSPLYPQHFALGSRTRPFLDPLTSFYPRMMQDWTFGAYTQITTRDSARNAQINRERKLTVGLGVIRITVHLFSLTQTVRSFFYSFRDHL